jgi:hypothetical protein
MYPVILDIEIARCVLYDAPYRLRRGRNLRRGWRALDLFARYRWFIRRLSTQQPAREAHQQARDPKDRKRAEQQYHPGYHAGVAGSHLAWIERAHQFVGGRNDYSEAA